MIYILCKDEFYEYSDLDDIVIIASTKIDDILEYVYKKVNINNLFMYSILIKSENDDYSSATFTPAENAYENFMRYTPTFFLIKENEKEYENVKHQLSTWCNAMKAKKEKYEEERKKELEKAKEAKERKLYEELKAKYGE